MWRKTSCETGEKRGKRHDPHGMKPAHTFTGNV
jgi:hypothetical protein